MGIVRHFMSRDRYKAISAKLHICDPTCEGTGKLGNLSPLLSYIRGRCTELYQATDNVSVGERMVRSRGRSGIRQFIANNLRFGFKLWVLAESDSGYTLNVDVYIGKRQNHSEFWASL